MQEVAMKLVKHGEQLRDPASVKPWLRRVAVNAAVTAGRRQTVRRRAMPERLEASGRDPAVEEDRESADTIADGKRALELTLELPEEYREPLVLRAVRGLSYRQIGDILGLPVTTIETRLVRARRMVRERLEEEAVASEAGRGEQERCD